MNFLDRILGYFGWADVPSFRAAVLTIRGWQWADRIRVGDALSARAGANTVRKIERMRIRAGAWYQVNDRWTLYAEQSVMKKGGGAVHARELKKGDVLTRRTEDGWNAETTIVSIRKLVGNGVWRRMEVSGDHEYFQDGLLMHNASRYWVGGGASANWNATGNTNWGSLSGLQDNSSVPGSSDDVYLDGFLTGASDGTISANITIRSLDCTGYANTLTHNASVTLTVSGNGVNFTFSAGMTYTLGSNTTSSVTFTGTSGNTLVTTAGHTVGGIWMFSGAGGQWSLQDAFVSVNRIQLSNGTLTASAADVTCSDFVSVSGTRTLDMTGRTLELTGSGTVWNVDSSLAATWTGATLKCSYAGASARTIASYNSHPFNDVVISAGSGTFNFGAGSGGGDLHGLDCSGFTGNLAWNVGNSSGVGIRGNVTLGTGMTMSRTTLYTNAGIAWTGTSDQTIQSNGVTWNVGGSTTLYLTSGTATRTTELLDAFSTTEALSATANNSTFKTNGYALTGKSFSSTSNTRTVNMANSTVTLTGTGTVWNVAASGLTLTMTGSTVVITDASATAKTFTGGGKTYGTLEFAKGAGTSTDKITDNNTFDVLKNSGTAAWTLQLPNGGTQTISSAAGWQLNGSAGAILSITSVTGGTASNVSVASGTVSGSYMSLKDNHAAGGATFLAYGSTNVSGNTGWGFVSTAAKTKGLIYGVKTTPAATADSLRYAVKPKIEMTDSLKYAVKAAAAQDQEVIYHVITEQSPLEESLIYRVTVPAEKMKELIYAVRTVPGASQEEVQYAVRGKKPTSKGVIYDVVAPAGALTAGLIYGVVTEEAPVQESLRYAVVAGESSGLSLRYGISFVVIENLTEGLAYAITAPAEGSVAMRYVIARRPYHRTRNPYRPLP